MKGLANRLLFTSVASISFPWSEQALMRWKSSPSRGRRGIGTLLWSGARKEKGLQGWRLWRSLPGL